MLLKLKRIGKNKDELTEGKTHSSREIRQCRNVSERKSLHKKDSSMQRETAHFNFNSECSSLSFSRIPLLVIDSVVDGKNEK